MSSYRDQYGSIYNVIEVGNPANKMYDKTYALGCNYNVVTDLRVLTREQAEKKLEDLAKENMWVKMLDL